MEQAPAGMDAPAAEVEPAVHAPASEEVVPSAAAPAEEPDEGSPAAATERIGSKRVRPPDSSPVDELQLPASVVARIVKSKLPDDMQLGRDVRSGFSRAASIFILYVTATANDLCREAKRQTINASDVVAALDELEFDNLTPAVNACLQAYRAEQEKKKSQAQSAEPDEDAGDGDVQMGAETEAADEVAAGAE